jgi:hypothetical protein
MTSLKKQAEDLGIEVDGRWNDDTLKEKIAEARAAKSSATSTNDSSKASAEIAPVPAQGEARIVTDMGGVRVETAAEVQASKEGENQPVAPYPGDPRESHALAVEQSQRPIVNERPDLPPAGSLAATEAAEEVYPIRLLYDWWDGQGVRHPRDEVVDMPLNEAQKLMDEGKGEYAGQLSPTKR